MLEAFNGDRLIETEILRLVTKHRTRTIVETGTYLGATTRAFAAMVPKVFTIEIDPDYWQLAGHLDALGNVRRIQGDSGPILAELLPALEQPALFYLDAHWKEHSPLLDELEAIAVSGQRPVIVIHDFLNPEHPDFGFDQWDIGVYRLELIHSTLVAIYGVDGWVHHMNFQAEGSKRGVIYIEPEG
jgi:hypothetical protein